MLNLNNVPDDDNKRDFELIPDGTTVRAFIKLEGGSTELPEYGAGSFFEVSQATNAKWLPIELTIIGGDFDKRKIWHRIFVDGTKMGASGMPIAKEIGLRTMKSIIDSAFGLDPKDQSEASQHKRNLQGINQLNGMEFCFKVGIEKSTNPQYGDKNKIKIVLTPDMNGFIAGSVTQSAPVISPMQQSVATQAVPQQTATAGVIPSWAK